MTKRAVLLALAVGGWGGHAQAFVVSPFYQNGASWTADEKAVVQKAITDWTSTLALDGDNDQTISIAFSFSNAGNQPGDYLAQWQGALIDPGHSQAPYSGGVLHHIYVNADFLPVDSWSLDSPVADAGLYDMLTVMRHELGHALGFAPGYYTINGVDRWLSHVSDGVFDEGGLGVPLDATNAHVNMSGDLMNPSLAKDVREEITGTDVEMLSLAYGFSAVPEPGTLALLGTAAAGMVFPRRGQRR